MSTQPTNLPVPSESPRDLKFNAGKIDEFVTSMGWTYTDRFGGKHYTIEGINHLAQQVMSAFGYVTLPGVTFTTGATVSTPNEVLFNTADNSYYKWTGSFASGPKVVPANSTPASTGGVGPGKWLSVADSTLRGELASDSGAGIVGAKDEDGHPTTVQNALNDFYDSKPVVPTDYYISAFFRGAPNYSIRLCRSSNGTDFYTISDTDMLTIDGQVVSGGNPGLIHFKGYWYITISNQSSANDFKVWRSPDLVCWELFRCKAGDGLYGKPGSYLPGGTVSTIEQLWAARPVIVNDEFYVVMSAEYKPSTTDLDGNHIYFMASVYTKCTDMSAMTFSPASLLMEDNSVSRIDPCIVEVDGKYVLSIKNEFNKEIELWESLDFVGGYTKNLSIGFGEHVEAPYLVKDNSTNVWRLYVDSNTNNGRYLYKESPDLVSWGTSKLINADGAIRAGTIYNVVNGDGSRKAWGNVASVLAESAPSFRGYGWNYRGDLSSGVNTVLPVANTVYVVKGGISATLTINAKGGGFFYLLVSAGYSNATTGITVNGTAVDSGFSIGYGQTNLRVFKVVWSDKDSVYRLEGRPNDLTGNIAFSTIAGYPTITNAWAPQHGVTYNIAGGQSVTINGISNAMPDGAYFHLYVGSANTTDKITISSSGTNIVIGNSNIILSASTNTSDRLFTMKKIGGTWRMCAY